MKNIFDTVMAFLPFEPDVFAANDGPPCHFVGHPIVERLEDLEPLPDFKKKYHLKPEDVPLAVLPGSRINEVNELVPVFGQVLHRRWAYGEFASHHSIGAAHMADRVREKTAHWPGKPIYIENEVDKACRFSGLACGICLIGHSDNGTGALWPANSGRL